jgi:hypothetical protein
MLFVSWKFQLPLQISQTGKNPSSLLLPFMYLQNLPFLVENNNKQGASGSLYVCSKESSWFFVCL